MDEIERKARELLAAEYERHGVLNAVDPVEFVVDRAAVAAIAAALCTTRAADALGAVRETGAVESLRGLAAVIRTYGTCAPSALDVVADRIEAALAQAPAVRVTDELVERAAREVWKVDRDHWLGGSAAFIELHPSDYARLLAIARAALEAALGQEKAS